MCCSLRTRGATAYDYYVTRNHKYYELIKMQFGFSFIQTFDKHGITPLLAAIWEGHVDCVRILLENGAEKGGKAPDGTSYIDSAEKQEIRALLA